MAQIIAPSLREHRQRATSVLVIALTIALAILTITGVGTVAFVSLIGMAICAICFFRKEAYIDWWIFIPLAAYVLMNFISAWCAWGDPLYGYGPLHIIYLSLYAAACSLRDAEAKLLRLLCVGLAVVAAVAAIIGFIVQSFTASATRLEYVVGTPNGLGIFFVLAWFALESSRMEVVRQKGTNEPSTLGRSRLYHFLSRCEPLILVALAMTLSMGSLVALGIGLIVLFISRFRATGGKEAFRFATVILSRIFLSIAIGFLMYMAGERADAPILCLVILAYITVMICLWNRFDSFLKSSGKFANIISLVGLLCIPFALFMRPNAGATFAERFEMMGNGISYLGVDPLVGMGPFTWRLANIQDAGNYFNTNHIHNIFIHAGVEFGLIAMAALIIIAVRVFIKRYREAQHGEDAALLFHMLTDTGFFYVGIVGMFIFTANGSITPAKKLSSVGTKLLFGCLFLLHFIILWGYIASF